MCVVVWPSHLFWRRSSPFIQGFDVIKRVFTEEDGCTKVLSFSHTFIMWCLLPCNARRVPSPFPYVWEVVESIVFKGMVADFPLTW